MSNAEVIDFLLSGFTDNSGQPLAGGLVYTYRAGTTTNKTTWTNSSMSTPEANPIVLDSNGRKQVYGLGSYKLVVKTAAGATLYTFDNLRFGKDSSFLNVTEAGAVGDGVTNDTAALQSALDAGYEYIYIPEGTYKCGGLVIPNGVRKIYGPGVLSQRVTGENILNLTSVNDITIEGLKLVGISGNVTASSNEGILATGCQRLSVINCTITGVRANGIYCIDCQDVLIEGNLIYGISDSGYRGRAVKRARVIGNTIRDTQLLTDFTIAMMVDTGTNGHAYGVGEDSIFSGNIIKNYPNAQGIMGHAGKRYSVVNNIIENVSNPISFNSYSGAGTADDIEDLTIQGNSVRCTTTALTDPGTFGIFVGGGASETVINISICGNTIRRANAGKQELGAGGIGVGYADNVAIVGNSVMDSYVCGISIINPVTNLLVSENVIRTVSLATQSNGVYIASSSAGTSGRIIDNIIHSVTDGVRASGACPNLLIDRNQFISVTSEITNVGNCLWNSRIPYTAGDTTPSVKHGGKVTTMVIANSGATSITNFDDGFSGQVLVCRFNDSNTTITRGTNMKLAASTNFTSADRSILTLINDDGVWYEISRVTNNG